MPDWVVFNDGSKSGTVQVDHRKETFVEALEAMGKTEDDVADSWSIPYPASPVLRRIDHCPSFCLYPTTHCKGKSCCPNNPSCTS